MNQSTNQQAQEPCDLLMLCNETIMSVRRINDMIQVAWYVICEELEFCQWAKQVGFDAYDERFLPDRGEHILQ